MTLENTHEPKFKSGDQGAGNSHDGSAEKAHYSMLGDVMNTATFSALNGWNKTVNADESHKAEKSEVADNGQMKFSDVYMAIKATGGMKPGEGAVEDNEERKRASAGAGFIAFDQHESIYPTVSTSAAKNADLRFDEMVNRKAA